MNVGWTEFSGLSTQEFWEAYLNWDGERFLQFIHLLVSITSYLLQDVVHFVSFDAKKYIPLQAVQVSGVLSHS